MEVVHIRDAAPNGDIKTEYKHSDFCGGLQINLPVVSSVRSLKIEVKGFNNLNVVWLANIMRQYENQLWMRLIIDRRMRFKCLFCCKVLYRFCSLKCHLFNHLQIFPFKCFACSKTYTSNNTLSKHTKKKHNQLRLALNARY